MNTSGPSREPNGRNGTCILPGMPIRCLATGACRLIPRDRNTPIITRTIPATLRRPWAETTAAPPISSRGGRRTSDRWKCAATYSVTPATLWNQTWKSRDPSRASSTPPPLHGHGLDRQTGGRVPLRLRHEPLRRHPEGPFSEGFTSPSLLEPDNVYAYEIDLGVTGNVFQRGHRIRLEISSSNFPRFDRNLNTGGSLASETEMRQANQTVYHSRQYPSHILLPVIPVT